MSLARRSVTAAAWEAIASGITVVVLFVRSVLLARWLPVEVFGVYGLAGAVVGLSAVVVDFGMGSAFLHRAPETADEEAAAAVHLTLKLVLTSIWAALLLVGIAIYAGGPTRLALLVIALTTAGHQLVQTPGLILTRRVVHRRLALTQALNALLTTLAALGLAWQGMALAALLAVDVVGLILAVGALYVWQPVWRPRLTWSTPVVCYYLRFGSRTFAAGILSLAIERLDDLWTGFYLGEAALGYYSRAFRFATYPRSVVAAPINAVVGGTYAELKEHRLALSRAFFRANAFLVRVGFAVAGLLALVAPEFIRLVLGDKWLPMLATFRLMLIFTMLDPIKGTIAGLFVAVGRPGQLVRTQAAQLATLATGLLLLGPSLGITGVALAVDIMVVVGVASMFWRARVHVDFRPVRVFAVPGLALTLGMLLARYAITLPGLSGSDWRTGTTKLVVFSTVYGMLLLGLEQREVRDLVTWLRDRLSVSGPLPPTVGAGLRAAPSISEE